MLRINFKKTSKWWALGCAALCLATLMACNHTNSPIDTAPSDTIPTITGEGDTLQQTVQTDMTTPEDVTIGEDVTSPDGDTTISQETTPSPSDTPAQTEQESPTAPEVLTLGEPETRPAPELELSPDDVQKVALPRIDIITEGGQGIESKDVYVNAAISVSDCDEAYVLSDCAAQIRVRGNSTATAPKKPYRIKFVTKQSMLGLNDGEAFRSWCLMADYFDASMLRTWATFSFADVLLKNKYYSSDATPVEVYVNGDYRGVYLLCEQTQINNDRIDIYEKEDNETSVEIGYLMIGQGGRSDEPESIVVYPEITVYDRNGANMHFSGMNFALSGDGYTDEQKAYVVKYTSAVFKVVAAALYEDKYYSLDRNGNMTLRPASELRGMTKQEKQIDTIDKVFCIESAVRMCILDEIVKNLDAMTFNMYVDLSPTGDGRLTLAAPWDFDFAMGNTNYATTHSTSGFYATNLSYSEGMRTNLWYVMLGSIDWFEEMMKEVWQANYSALQEVAMETLRMTYAYADAYDHDWARWGAAANRSLIHHHCAADLQSFTCHADNGRFVNDWLLRRLKWLNRQWGDGSDMEENAQPLVLDLTKQENMIYFKDYKRCEGKLSDRGLHVTAADGRDPYFTFDLSETDEVMLAEDYTTIVIEYIIPRTNTMDGTYSCELFLCTGNVLGATGGISVQGNLSEADGKTHTLTIDLSQSGYWNGEIHNIRIDFFNFCDPGDSIYIKSITFK